MPQPTKELILEILEAGNADSSSPPIAGTPGVSPVDPGGDTRNFWGTPSPFKGEGWGEGKDHGQLSGVVVGQLRDVNDQGQPLVNFPGNLCINPILARSTIHVERSQLGQDVVLVFDQGDLRKPIIMGILYSSDKKSSEIDINEESGQTQPPNVELDGERLTFTASKEIVLKCGKASITLTKAGKILIRGEYLLNRSSGVNRIQGGSVQIN